MLQTRREGPAARRWTVVALTLLALAAVPARVVAAAAEPMAECEPCLCCGQGCVPLPASQHRDPDIRGRKAWLLGSVAGFVAGSGFGIGADEAERFRTDLHVPREVALGLAGLAIFAAVDHFEDADVPLHRASAMDCESGCSRLGGVDRYLHDAWGEHGQGRFRARSRAAARSDALLGAAMAFPYGVVVGAKLEQPQRDALVIAEAQLLAGALNYAVKHLVHRPRPFAHFCDAQDSEQLCEHDSRTSFYSGHATMAAVSATMAWRLARRRGYENQGWIGAVGAATALATGYYRIAAEKHYFTDVVVGLAAGVGVALLVDELHGPEPGRPVPSPAGELQLATASTIPLRMGHGTGSGLWLGLGGVQGGFGLTLTARW